MINVIFIVWNGSLSSIMQRTIECFLTKCKVVSKYLLELFFLFLLIFSGKDKDISKNEKIKEIIIPLTAGIGDAVIFTSCLQQLNNIFLKARITILTTNRTHDVLNDTYPFWKFIKPSSLLKSFKFRNSFDLMILPSRILTNYLFALIINPKYLIGYNYSLTAKKGESHIVRANRILHQLGFNGFNDPLIKVAKTTINKSNSFFEKKAKDFSKTIVSLIVGGRWKSKTYSPLKYRILIVELLKKYDVNIFLIGNDEKMGKFIAEDRKEVYNFANNTSIQEAMGIIYHSDLIIGPDGGLLNIAIALNKPIIGLFGSVDPTQIVPKKYINQVLFVNNCKYQPCYNEEHEPICPYPEPFCMDIEIEDILSKTDKILPEKMRVK